MAFIEVYPNNKSTHKYGQSFFNDIRDYEACIEWDKDGDHLSVFLDTSTQKLAVYRWFGNVLCLYDRFDVYYSADNDHDETERKIALILQNEAIYAGFPTARPKPCMTWRDIRDQLNAIEDDDVLDSYAAVWLYDDFRYPNGSNRITSLDPYYKNKPAGMDNELSFNIEEV